MKKFYPTIFHPEGTGYSVSVPDLNGCFTQGDSLEEALSMATEAIGLYLEGETAPDATPPERVQVPDGDFLMVVEFDPVAYAKKHNHKAVKKTLSIPAWLNDLAEAANINYSRVLQEALKKQLNL